MDINKSAMNTSLKLYLQHSTTMTMTHAAFGIVTVMSLLSNGLVVIVMCRTKTLLGPVHSILLVNLAVADFLIGLFVLLTPGFVMGYTTFKLPDGIAGEIFCRTIASYYVIFTSGKVSIATIASLAVERWYAMARPLCHRSVYTRRKLTFYVLLIWCLCSLLDMRAFFENELETEGLSSPTRCAWVRFMLYREAAQGYTIVLVTVTFLVPLVLIWATYIHLAVLVRKSKGNPLSQGRRSRAARQLLRMSLVTAAVMFICWLPNQVVFVLAKFDVTSLDSTLHRVTIFFCVASACANPWIQCASNRKYRRAVFGLLCWRSLSETPQIKRPPDGQSNGYALGTCLTDAISKQIGENTGKGICSVEGRKIPKKEDGAQVEFSQGLVNLGFDLLAGEEIDGKHGRKES